MPLVQVAPWYSIDIATIKRDFIIPGFKAGTVGSLVSPGGAGKSMFGLMLTHQVACGVDLLGLGETQKGRVVYLSGEDDEEELGYRLAAIGPLLSLPDRAACDENIMLVDLTQDMKRIESKEFREELEMAAHGTRLIILDTLRVFHGADENSSSEMTHIVGILRAIAGKHNCSILFLHHSSKSMAVSGAGDMQQASRGSSVLTDNIRWQSYLLTMTEKDSEQLSDRTNGEPIGKDKRSYYVKFGMSKQNYGTPFEEKWYRRGKGGILEPVSLRSVAKQRNIEGGKGRDETSY
ncbi:MAG: helicase RepA family protein [bacterium]